MTKEVELYEQAKKTRFRCGLALGIAIGLLVSVGFLAFTGYNVCANEPSGLQQPVTEVKENSKQSIDKSVNPDVKVDHNSPKNGENKQGYSHEKLVETNPIKASSAEPSGYLKEADLLSKFMLVIKPLQEQKDIISHYESVVDVSKTYLNYYIPVFSTFFLFGLTSLGYYFVLHKTSETKEEISMRAQEQVDKARGELNEAKAVFYQLKKTADEEITKVDQNLQLLDKRLSDKINVRIN